MSLAGYLVGSLELLALGTLLGFAAYRLRLRFLPGWSRSPARLVEIILAISLFTLAAEALGTIGLLKEIPLLVVALLLAVAATRLPADVTIADRESPAGEGRSSTLLIVAGSAVGALVLARWLTTAGIFLDSGMWGYDTMWYHLPFAARFAQSGSVTSLHFIDPLDLLWFYPENAELEHTAGMLAFHRDILSPLVNIGWLGLALLSAWCIGRPYRRALLSLLAGSIVLVTPTLLARQPGNAHTDAPVLALLMASAAILASGFGGRSGQSARPSSERLVPVVIAGLAAGLAVGTKLDMLAPVLGLTCGVVGFAAIGSRRRVMAAWLAPVLATGGYWYLRNLIAVGNPLPWSSLGIGLPTPARVVEITNDWTIIHFVGQGRIWTDFFFPGLNLALGDLWWALLLLAFAGGLGALLGSAAPIQRALGVCFVIGTIGYLLTPISAGGPGALPIFFGGNVRWWTPMLTLGLALLPTLGWTRRLPVLEGTLAIGMVVILLVTAGLGLSPHDSHLRGAVIVALVTATLLVLGVAAPRVFGRLELAVLAALVATLAIAVYWGDARNYLRQRYADVWPNLHLSLSYQWADQVTDARIGISGTTAAFLQYGYYGDHVSNEVQYIAQRGAHGSFSPIRSCQGYRTAVNRGHFDYLVTTPTLNPWNPGTQGFAPEQSWVQGDRAVRPILRDGPVTVWAIDGNLDPAGCAAGQPLFAGLPPLFARH
jgi:hypothetical protein